MSRGTAMSIRNSGRYLRWRRTASTCERRITACGAPVEAITTSTRSSTAGHWSKVTASPPISAASAAARSNERLATRMLRAPRESRHCAVTRPTSPAPSTITRLSLRRPKIFSASSTATLPTDVAPCWIEVSRRSRLPTANARWNSRLSAPPVSPAASACA